VQILNKTKNIIIADNVRVADSFWSRLVGLMNKNTILSNEALIITRCQSIHMFFMRFAIDAVFVDKNNTVVGLVRNIKPWQLSPIFFKASYVVELLPGAISKAKIEHGETIALVS